MATVRPETPGEGAARHGRWRGLLSCLPLLLAAACSQMERPETSAVAPSPEPTVRSEPAEQRPQPDRALVREIQENLNALGYGAGSADGVVGRKTESALQRFLETEGFPKEDTISDSVLGRLRFRVLEKRDEAESAQLYAAFPPIYQVGSSYVYSDGRVETVAGIKGDLVRWTGTDGSRFTTHRNFFVPPVYWERAEDSGSTQLDRDLSALWLQDVGQEASFVAHTTIKRAQDEGEDLVETKASWRCRALKRERLSARVGTFETLKVLCETSTKTASAPLRRVWHYARGLNHYLRLSEGAGQDRAAELVAIRPRVSDWPPITRAALGRAIEWALSTADDGQALPWSSSAVDTQVTIAVSRSFRDERGAPCRSFFQVWTDSRGKRRYPGVACRGETGEWSIPGVRDARGQATAISKWMS